MNDNKEFDPVQDFFSDVFDHHMEDATVNFKNDIFLSNKYIKETLEKYKYDYGRLLKRLTVNYNNDKIGRALTDCEISIEEYNNPTAEVFETLRNYLLYGIKPEKKYLVEPAPVASPIQDIFNDLFEYHLENETWDGNDYFLDDEHIENTLRKYHYNYGRLMKRLVFNMSDENIKEALESCGISDIEYRNPSPTVFENMRDYVFNKKKINNK